jgi:hypothetical protein
MGFNSVLKGLKSSHTRSIHFVIMLSFGIGRCVLRQTWTGVALKSAASITMVHVPTQRYIPL